MNEYPFIAVFGYAGSLLRYHFRLFGGFQARGIPLALPFSSFGGFQAREVSLSFLNPYLQLKSTREDLPTTRAFLPF
jgi:hypothetical protein